MWSTYMKEATEYDKQMTDGLKEGAMGPLVFVGINSLI
jgi:mannose/fructose/N-acetylgalactosamine-specific phosphotransferase system component IID